MGNEFRNLFPAARLGIETPGVKPATGRRVDGAGHVAFEDQSLADHGGIRHRRGREQGLGIRVKGGSVQGPAVGQFHNFSQVHHRHPVAHMLHHRQVMGDKQIGQAEFRLEVLEQIDDLGLDRHVQGRHRLIADDQIGIQGQGTGHADALALAPGELVGVATHVLLSQPHDLQQFENPPLTLAPIFHAVDQQGLTDNLRHGLSRIEGRKRILENDLHSLSKSPHLQRRTGQQVLAVKIDLTGSRLFQPENDPAEGGLSAARLAHQPQGLAPVDGQGYIVHRTYRGDLFHHHTAQYGEVLDDMSHVEKGFWALVIRHISSTVPNGCPPGRTSPAGPGGSRRRHPRTDR